MASNGSYVDSLENVDWKKTAFYFTLNVRMEIEERSVYRVSQNNCAPFVWLLWRSCRLNYLGFYQSGSLTSFPTGELGSTEGVQITSGQKP